MRIKPIFFLAAVATALVALNSCLGDDDSIYSDYSEWRLENEAYLTRLENETAGGEPVYEKISPAWDNSIYILMRWINERNESDVFLTPLSNSTVSINYRLTDIEGNVLDSANNFVSQPNAMITGFWTALTNMREKDTVTAVIPYEAGYGVFGSGSVLPFSTLTFGIRLDSIIAYESKI